jgi:hypothetical protein
VGLEIGERLVESSDRLPDEVVDGVGAVKPIRLDVDAEFTEGDADRDGAPTSASGVSHRTASKVSR